MANDPTVTVPADVVQKEMQEEDRLIKQREEYNKAVGLNVGVVRGPTRDARFYQTPAEDDFAKRMQERVVDPSAAYPIKVVGAEGPNAAYPATAPVHTQGFRTPDTTMVDETLDIKDDRPEIVHSGKVVPGAVMVDETAAAQKPTAPTKSAATTPSAKTPTTTTPSAETPAVDPYAPIPESPK